MGMFAMDRVLVEERCGLSPLSKVCKTSAIENFACARVIYAQDDNTWKSFPAAKACGCYSGL